MNYCRKHYKTGLFILLPCVAYNLYFIFLLPDVNLFFLIYLDMLLLFIMAVCIISNYVKEKQRENTKRVLLKEDFLIYQEFQDREDTDIIEHDITVLKKQIQSEFDANCELQDYMARWCHDIKVPLAAALLMIDKIEEPSVRQSVQEQLERMNLQLKSVLLGAKLQSSLFDLQIREVSLSKCIKKSIHNNQFFLVRKHFTLQIQPTGEEDIHVYTDPSWLVYVLDQLINNAIKYTGEEPVLKIYVKKHNEEIQLCVEDNGEGIKESDIRRIFEKGYTGSNYHNGQYKSTGMGLYMSAMIMERLGHHISVESRYGEGSRFTITFSDNREYFFK